MNTHTVSPELYNVLKKLMDKPYLKSFNLVGGTSLSLQIGHRLSIDIDLFTHEKFSKTELLSAIQNDFELSNIRITDIALQGYIGRVAVDFVDFQWPLLKPLLVNENIRMVSMEDIAAMKLFAIGNGGYRMKDYVDIAYLNSYFSLHEMLGFFKHKFELDAMFVLPHLNNLSRLNVADSSFILLAHNHTFTWTEVEKKIDAMMKNPSTLNEKEVLSRSTIETKKKWWKL